MELHLTFQQGQMTGEGRDYVGTFIVRGQYSIVDGKCYWTKRYVGKHDVFYQGYNEGKGIWGVWEIPTTGANSALRGGFHIWPEGMSDPTHLHLTEQAEIPIPISETVGSDEQVAEPVGARTPLSMGRRNARASMRAARNGRKRQRFPAIGTHASVANLPCVIAQLALAPRTAEVMDCLVAGFAEAHEEECTGRQQGRPDRKHDPKGEVHRHTRNRLPLRSLGSKRRCLKSWTLPSRRIACGNAIAAESKAWHS
jgi:hypothetical protein